MAPDDDNSKRTSTSINYAPSVRDVTKFVLNASLGNYYFVESALDAFGKKIVNARDIEGETALFAVVAGEPRQALQIVALLLRHGANVDKDSIDHALRTYQLQIFDLLSGSLC